MPPKVFVSHASEDKDRFVVGFCKQLISKGIDVWLDTWEMYPGDSLIDKIFGEGLREADVVIVILSRNSIEKPWVKEELNAAVVKKINSEITLIPIILDNVPVPECLRTTVWQKIENTENYEDELNRIVASIFRVKNKPELGPSPKYSRNPILVIPSLTREDNLIFKIACEKAIEQDSRVAVTNSLLQAVSQYDIGKEQLYESLEILAFHSLIEFTRLLSGDIHSYKITVYGLDRYSMAFIQNYDQMVNSVIFDIINTNHRDSNQIARSVNVRKLLVENILQSLASQGLITITKYMQGILVGMISAQLKRQAEKN